VTRRLDAIAQRGGRVHEIEVVGRRLRTVTDQNRCFLGEQEQRVVASLLREYPDDFLPAGPDPAGAHDLPIPKILDIRAGTAVYDETQLRKQPDWTYA
jgi:hypothetical protein